jgi:glycosyltransferase involved in cell wall biosynthesis
MPYRNDVGIIILERGKEVSIASTIFKLKYGIDENLDARTEIVVIDNGSEDETASLARMAGARVVRFKQRVGREKVIQKAVEVGIEKKHAITVFLDRMGGNYAEDAISLVSAALESGKDFASGYVVPTKGEDTIGCLALDHAQLKKLSERGEEVSSFLLEMARKQNLNKVVFNESVEVVSKKKKGEKNGNGGSFWQKFTELRRGHPLKFYGGLGILTLLASLGSGFYTVDYFYKHQNLYYPTAFATALMVMIAGFLLVAGLMLNALTVMVNRIKSVKKWESANKERRCVR